MLDRQILEVICKHGRDGQSFNKLVAEAKGFASRSTFALRAKRLEKLNYIERLPDEKNKQMKRIRGKPMMLLVMRIASRMRSQCAELEQAIQRRAESLGTQKILNNDELDDQKRFINQTNDKIKGVFSLIGVYAVNLGESVAGDLLLPMVIDNFKKVSSAVMSLLASNPQLMQAVADEKLVGIPLEELKDDFRYAFGTEVNRALPRFSKRLKALAHGQPK
ncbi:MAG: hypothetical protein QW334_03840 [Thermofilum sp.]